jgi:hypothetical protein
LNLSVKGYYDKFDILNLVQKYFFHRIRFNIPPVMSVAAIIIKADLRRYHIPNSLKRTMKVAIQGKNMARATLPMTSCSALNCKGASIPTAISLRKNPITIAVTASWGNPRIPVTTGAVKLAIASNTPNRYKTLIISIAPNIKKSFYQKIADLIHNF